MEISLNRGIEKYDILNTGKALLNFINNSKVTYNKIGVYSESRIGGMKDIVASGHMIYDIDDNNKYESPSTVYTKIDNTVIDKKALFKNETGVRLVKILSDYLELTMLSEEEKEALIQKLKDINSKKALVITFKPKTQYKINAGDVNVGFTGNDMGKITIVKWLTNKETYELECSLVFEVTGKHAEEKLMKINASDYISKFRPERMEYWTDANKADNSLIEATKLGIIKPVEITDGKQSIVIDNTYMYWCHNGIISIIGEWDYVTGNMNLNTETVKAIGKSDIYKYTKTNLNLIGGHRNLIAPYLLYETHVYNTAEGKKKGSKK